MQTYKYILTDGEHVYQECDDMTQEMVDILNDAAVEFMGGDLWWTSVEPKEAR